MDLSPVWFCPILPAAELNGKLPAFELAFSIFGVIVSRQIVMVQWANNLPGSYKVASN
jgi:hypothetical protein